MCWVKYILRVKAEEYLQIYLNVLELKSIYDPCAAAWCAPGSIALLAVNTNDCRLQVIGVMLASSG